MEAVNIFCHASEARRQRAKSERERQQRGDGDCHQRGGYPLPKIVPDALGSTDQQRLRGGPFRPEVQPRDESIAFIEKRDQADIIRKIFKHCGIWGRAPPRASPPKNGPPEQSAFEMEYVEPYEFLMGL